MPLRPEKRHTQEDYSHVFQMGEDKAFDFFFRQYYSSLCFFANAILHNEDEAKDLVQDCFVKLWHSQTINERSDTVKSFLYTMVRNKCLDFLRKKKVVRKAELQLIKNNNDLDFEYFDEVAFADMIPQIVDYIKELPAKMRQIFKLYYIEGKKYKQIANELNSSPEAVRKQKARALKIIRRKFLLLLSIF